MNGAPTILSASLRIAIWHPTRARDEEIRELHRGGAGIRAMARRFDLAPSRIHQIVTP